MPGELLELATMSALVGAVPGVDVLSMRTTHDSVGISSASRAVEWVPVVSVEIHTASMLDAECLLDRLGLFGDATRAWETAGKHGEGPRLWQAWAGWVASASDDVPVSVAVVASAEIPVEDPYDPTTDPWSREHNAAEAVPAGAVA